jgi:rubrerythrin
MENMHMATEIEQEILVVLEEAIKREQAAYKLYSRGKELCGKSELKKIFTMLAEEERGHEQLLKQVYYDYKKKLGLKVLRSGKKE